MADRRYDTLDNRPYVEDDCVEDTKHPLGK